MWHQVPVNEMWVEGSDCLVEKALAGFCPAATAPKQVDSDCLTLPSRSVHLSLYMQAAQWVDEAKMKTLGHSVLLYHGASRTRYTAAMLATADIVVSTYDVLASEAQAFPKGPLIRVEWHR